MEQTPRFSADEYRQIESWQRVLPVVRGLATAAHVVFWACFAIAAIGTPILYAVALWQEGDPSARQPRLDLVIYCWIGIGLLWLVGRSLNELHRLVVLVCRFAARERAAAAVEDESQEMPVG
jgi:hypothetical protein